MQWPGDKHDMTTWSKNQMPWDSCTKNKSIHDIRLQVKRAKFMTRLLKTGVTMKQLNTLGIIISDWLRLGTFE